MLVTSCRPPPGRFIVTGPRSQRWPQEQEVAVWKPGPRAAPAGQPGRPRASSPPRAGEGVPAQMSGARPCAGDGVPAQMSRSGANAGGKGLDPRR